MKGSSTGEQEEGPETRDGMAGEVCTEVEGMTRKGSRNS